MNEKFIHTFHQGYMRYNLSLRFYGALAQFGSHLRVARASRERVATNALRLRIYKKKVTYTHTHTHTLKHRK